MKKLLTTLFLAVALIVGAQAQSFSLTNTYNLTNTVQVVQTVNFGNGMVSVVSSAGAPLTNSSLWATWIPRYITNNVYTNGITLTNSDVRVLWGEPKAQLRGIYQGNPPFWNGSNYVRLNIAVDRILAGERLHVLIGVTDQSTTLTNLALSSNVIYNASGVLYKVIELPKSKPPGY